MNQSIIIVIDSKTVIFQIFVINFDGLRSLNSKKLLSNFITKAWTPM